MLVAIVHLSDIHFAKIRNPVESRVRQLAAAICSSESSCTTYVVVISGDIANTGDPDEYNVAGKFLDALVAAMREHRPGADVAFVSVPGNHDCFLPANEHDLRTALIKGIEPSFQNKVPDQSILNLLLEKQKAYFEFRRSLAFPGKKVSGDLVEHAAFGAGNFSVYFALYNTAVLSTRREQQGELVIPMGVVVSQPADVNCDISVSVFHHPYPWLQADNGIAFRDYVERTSDIALTGHQHSDHAYSKETISQSRILYSEGNVLQDPDRHDYSGFRVILLSSEDKTRRIVTYRWNRNLYSAVEDSEWHNYQKTKATAAVPSPTSEFLRYLSESVVPLAHPTEGAIPLESIFIYQDATSRLLSSPRSEKNIGGARLLEHLTSVSKCIVRGSAYSGKTALAKTVIKEWLRHGASSPILLSGGSIKHADKPSVDRIVAAAITRSYGLESVESYRQLPLASKVVLVDDWDENHLNIEDHDEFLRSLVASFGRVILFVRGVAYMQHVFSKVKGNDFMLDFDLVTLQEMSHVSRGGLIDKWLSLDGIKDTSKFARRVEETERLIQSVIGKNTLPSLPLIVLSLLVASDRSKDVLPENGSFGYLYEVLITAALNSTLGEKRQLDKKYTFLSILAFRLFDTQSELIGISQVDSLLDDYARDYRIKLDKTALLRDLEDARILVREDGNYQFGYAHYFYYFLARFFKNNLGSAKGPELRKRLNGITNGLNTGSNSIFLMFVIYLTHDGELMDHIVRLGDSILAEVPPSELTKEVDFYNSKDVAGIDQQIPESVDLDVSRRHRREHADVVRERDTAELLSVLGPDIDSSGYSQDLPLGTKLNYAVSCIEMLGQVLRNFTGSLPGDRKLSILRTTYGLGLRVLRAMLVEVGDATYWARGELSKKEPQTTADRKFAKQIEELLTIIGQIVGGSSIHMISLNVGSGDIEEQAYAVTLEAVGRNNATELVDLAIKLDHSDEYPYEQIKRLRKQFDCNRFAFLVLKDLVIAHMHVFDITREMRQRVLALFNEKSSSSAMLSRETKRLKQ